LHGSFSFFYNLVVFNCKKDVLSPILSYYLN
jgi:hypothetical protein